MEKNKCQYINKLEPTYLRYVYDGLNKGLLNASNASALPQGFIGLFENEFPANISSFERTSLLKRLALWALFKAAVSTHLASEILQEDEEETKALIDTYSKWFNSTEPGKYILYHDRLRTYFLQKLSSHEIQSINETLISYLEAALERNIIDEANEYALQHLATHMAVESQLDNNYDRLYEFVSQENLWERQVRVSKEYKWSQEALKYGIKESARRNNEKDALMSSIKKLNLISDEQKNYKEIFNLIRNNDIELALKRAANWKGEMQFRIYIYILMKTLLGEFKFYCFDNSFFNQIINKLKKLTDDSSNVLEITKQKTKQGITLKKIHWSDFFPQEVMFSINLELEKRNIDFTFIWQSIDYVDYPLLIDHLTYYFDFSNINRYASITGQKYDELAISTFLNILITLSSKDFNRSYADYCFIDGLDVDKKNNFFDVLLKLLNSLIKINPHYLIKNSHLHKDIPFDSWDLTTATYYDKTLFNYAIAFLDTYHRIVDKNMSAFYRITDLFEHNLKKIEKYIIAYNKIFVTQQTEKKKIKSDFTKKQAVSIIELKEQLLDKFFNQINGTYSELKESVQESQVYDDDDSKNYDIFPSFSVTEKQKIYEHISQYFEKSDQFAKDIFNENVDRFFRENELKRNIAHLKNEQNFDNQITRKPKDENNIKKANSFLKNTIKKEFLNYDMLFEYYYIKEKPLKYKSDDYSNHEISKLSKFIGRKLVKNSCFKCCIDAYVDEESGEVSFNKDIIHLDWEGRLDSNHINFIHKELQTNETIFSLVFWKIDLSSINYSEDFFNEKLIKNDYSPSYDFNSQEEQIELKNLNNSSNNRDSNHEDSISIIDLLSVFYKQNNKGLRLEYFFPILEHHLINIYPLNSIKKPNDYLTNSQVLLKTAISLEKSFSSFIDDPERFNNDVCKEFYLKILAYECVFIRQGLLCFEIYKLLDNHSDERANDYLSLSFEYVQKAENSFNYFKINEEQMLNCWTHFTKHTHFDKTLFPKLHFNAIPNIVYGVMLKYFSEKEDAQNYNRVMNSLSFANTNVDFSSQNIIFNTESNYKYILSNSKKRKNGPLRFLKSILSNLSSFEIVEKSCGEVLTPDTIIEITNEVCEDGLFCEKIFGTISLTYNNSIMNSDFKIIYDNEINRIGHISTELPVFIDKSSSLLNEIASFLKIKVSDLKKIINCECYLVIQPGKAVDIQENPLKVMDILTLEEYMSALNSIPTEYKYLDTNDKDNLIAKTGAELFKSLTTTNSIDLPKELIDQIDSYNFNIIPVVSPRLRPMIKEHDSNVYVVANYLNDTYRRILIRSNRLKRLLKINAPEQILIKERRLLQQSISNLTEISLGDKEILDRNTSNLVNFYIQSINAFRNYSDLFTETMNLCLKINSEIEDYSIRSLNLKKLCVVLIMTYNYHFKNGQLSACKELLSLIYEKSQDLNRQDFFDFSLLVFQNLNFNEAIKFYNLNRFRIDESKFSNGLAWIIKNDNIKLNNNLLMATFYDKINVLKSFIDSLSNSEQIINRV